MPTGKPNITVVEQDNESLLITDEGKSNAESGSSGTGSSSIGGESSRGSANANTRASASSSTLNNNSIIGKAFYTWGRNISVGALSISNGNSLNISSSRRNISGGGGGILNGSNGNFSQTSNASQTNNVVISGSGIENKDENVNSEGLRNPEMDYKCNY